MKNNSLYEEIAKHTTGRMIPEKNDILDWKNAKYYEITYAEEERKQKALKLWNEVKDNGEYISGGWDGDYWKVTYKYNGKYYDLDENMELGIKSCIKEYDLVGKENK